MSNELPARWRDDDAAPAELREIGTVLESLDQPPPAGARARVWAEMEPERRAPRVPRLVWAGAAALAVAALVVAPRLVREDVARVEMLVGKGTLHQDGARANVGQIISAGARLTTGDGRAVVRLQGVGMTYLAESTSARVGAESILLDHGTVVTEVRPRGNAPAFHVVAGDYDVHVVGTLFAVTRAGEHVDVRVKRGKVEVRGPRGSTSVGAGESFSSRGGAVAPIAVEAIDLLDGRAPVSLIGEQVHEPVAVPRAAEPTPRPRLQRQAAADPTPAVAPEPSAALTKAPVDEAEPTPEAAPAVPEGEKYVQAVGSEDTERAIALFDELIAGGGPRAELAAYQAARLSRTRDLNEAIRRYEQLLSAHPDGVFGQEARLDVIECAMQLGRWKKAAYHIDVFLDAYPDSERTAEVRFLRAEVARHGHDCASAIADYDAALSSPRRVGDAMFFKAWCLLRYEKTAAALPLLERYLERFPTGRHAAEARQRVTEIRALEND